MANFSERKDGSIFVVEGTGQPQMAILMRNRKEKFTDFIDREAKAQSLKVVVNGSFTAISSANNFWSRVSNDPIDPRESTPVGFVVSKGREIGGSSSAEKFYFSQNVCGQDRYSAGLGNPPMSSCAAVGGLAPIISNRLPYGTYNKYSSGVAEGAPATGTVDAKYQKHLVQKSNAMFTQLEGSGTAMGKVAVGFSSNKQTLMIVVQPDGASGGVDVEKVRTMFTMKGVDNAVFMDCSSSATLWYNGKFEARPSEHKDVYLDVAIGFK
jgi:hypothetical protein